MSDSSGFGRMVPGFDFLQGMMKSASAAAPAVGQWIAPTLDPAELDKRINDLKTVHFWLEQNASLLGATIQALEVQRMTLSTLQSMNLPVADMVEAFKFRMPESAPAAPAPAPVAEAPAAPPEPAPEPAPAPSAAAAAAAAAAGVVDPMQWWGALTKQFTELAAGALRDAPAEPAGKAAAEPATAPAKKAAVRKTAPRRRT